MSYSTSETFTGKYWTDGKPIYRKVYYSGSGWGQYNIIDTIPNISLINVTSIAYDTSQNQIIGSLPEGQNSVYLSGAYLRALRSGIFETTYPSTIIVEYIKTS